MKTHDEIKKGLECCTPVWTGNHWKTCDPKCPYLGEGSFCRAVLSKDVGEEIRRLETKLAEYEKPLMPLPVPPEEET